MAFDWEGTQQEIAEVIIELGRPIAIRNFNTTPSDPNRPWDTPPPSVIPDCPTHGVFVDPNKSEDNLDFSEKLHYRSSIRRSTYNIYIPALGLTFVPKPGDKVLDTAEEFQIVTVSPIKPGTLEVAYILQVEI